MALLLVALVTYCRLIDPRCGHRGESPQYVTAAVALSRHGGISFTREDVECSNAEFHLPEEGARPALYSYSDRTFLHRWATGAAKGKPCMRRLHYWGTYSAVCIPAWTLCRRFGWFADNRLNAFKVTNVALLMVVLFGLLFVLKGRWRERLAFSLAFAFMPVTQYVNWASAEIFIYAALVYCLVFLYNRSFSSSVFCLALAATMNITLLAFAPVIVAHFFGAQLEQSRWREMLLSRSFWWQLARLGLCFSPVMHSALVTYLQFGSLATMSGGRDFGGWFGRMAAYLLDLNFGHLVYYHVCFIVLPFLCCSLIARRDWRVLLGIAGGLMVVAGYSLMYHINSGMEGISRYAAWGGAILVFFVVWGCDKCWRKVSMGVVVAFCAVNLLVVLHPPHAKGSVHFGAVADFVIRHCPRAFYALPSTFISRTWHVDGGYAHHPMAKNGDVRFDQPACHRSGGNAIILCDRSMLEHFWDWFSLDGVGRLRVEERLTDLLRRGKTWAYVLAPSRIRLRKEIFTGRMCVTRQGMKNEDGSISIGRGDIMFGPYTSLEAGCYALHVRSVSGVGTAVSITTNAGECGILSAPLSMGETVIRFELVEDAKGVEFVISNDRAEPIHIDQLFVERL